MKKCYLSGAITDSKGYKEKFAKAEKEVKAMGMITLAKLCCLSARN
jgi:hypothetical protein